MIYNGDHAQFEIDNADVPPKERSDWPLPSFEAMDWAEAMHKSIPAIGIDVFLPWCASMLMRGYDEGRKP